MKIVICDDSIESLFSIERLVEEYADENNIDCEIEKYSDSNKLCENIEKGNLADIYMLDMIMPKKTGIDVAHKIRNSDKNKAIIFTTTSDDFAMDAYNVQAIRYILKPIDKNKFFEAIEFALSNINISREPLYLIKTKNGIISVPYSKILYIENVSRILNVYIKEGRMEKSLFIRKSFDNEIEELIEKRNFIQIHKSFVVNIDFVEKMTNNSMIMNNGKIVPISKNRLTLVKRKYLEYIADSYR